MRSGTAGLSALVAFAACSTPQFDITPRYGYLDVSGDIGVSSSGGGVSVSADNDVSTLGFDADDGVPGLRADFKWGMPHLVINYQRSDNSGSGEADANLSDGNGNVISAGTPVDSDLELGLLNGLLLFDLAPTDVLEVALGFGATAFDIDTAITEQSDPSNSISAKGTVPLPVLALQVGGEIGRFELAGLLQGISGTYDGNGATYADLDAYVRWRFYDRGAGIGLVLGYRYFLIDAEYDDDDTDAEIDMSFYGPYIGLQFSF